MPSAINRVGSQVSGLRDLGVSVFRDFLTIMSSGFGAHSSIEKSKSFGN